MKDTKITAKTMTEIKHLIIESSGKDFTVKSRKRELIYLKSVYVRLCRENIRTVYDRPIGFNAIGKSINLHHATVINLYNNTFENAYKNDDVCKTIYDTFHIGIICNEPKVNYKLQVRKLKNELIKLQKKYYKEVSLNESRKDIYDVIDLVPDDKHKILITRLKPMVKMLINSKFN